MIIQNSKLTRSVILSEVKNLRDPSATPQDDGIAVNFAFCPATVREQSERAQLRGSRYIPHEHSVLPKLHSRTVRDRERLTSLRSGYVRDILYLDFARKRAGFTPLEVDLV